MHIGSSLVGTLCTLADMDPAYLAKHVGFLNDPEVNKYLHIRPPFDIPQQAKWLKDVSNSERDIVFAALVEVEPSVRSFVGVMGLHELDRERRTARTGMIIGDKRIWRKGIATEAKSLQLHFAFETLGLSLIHSAVAEPNIASRKCLVRNGYVEVGSRRRDVDLDGKPCNEILYEISRASWLKQTRK